MKCEVIREGQVCGDDADFIVRTPWATQLACNVCVQSFKRYEMQRIDAFTCDWPVGGKECGARATHYFEGEGHQRPLCVQHATTARGITGLLNDAKFNPKLVPYKPPVQPPPRVEQKADGTVALRCWCGAAGRYRGGAEPMPLCDEHAPQTPEAPKQEPPAVSPASPIDIRTAARGLALLTLATLKEKVEKWRSR